MRFDCEQIRGTRATAGGYVRDSLDYPVSRAVFFADTAVVASAFASIRKRAVGIVVSLAFVSRLAAWSVLAVPAVFFAAARFHAAGRRVFTVVGLFVNYSAGYVVLLHSLAALHEYEYADLFVEAKL